MIGLRTPTTLLAALGLLLAAPATARDSVAAPSRIVVAMQQEPATLDPVIGTLAVESDAYNLLFDGLFRHNAAGELIPDLAQRVPTQANGDISRDGRTITYRLVANARWHDGVPVTSHDVKFTWKAVMNPRNNVANRGGYDEFTRIDTPNDTTVIVHLRRIWAPVIDRVYSDTIQGAIVPEHLLRDQPDLNHHPFNTNPIGSGPYRLTSWNHGSDMTFDANPAYFRGAPKIARIVWHFIPDQNAIANAVRAGEVDLATNIGPATYAQLGNAPGMLPALGPTVAWEHLTFNTASGPLADVRVRRALCMATDVRAIYAKIVHGIGLLGVGLENPHSRWYLKSLQPCPLDPARAAKLLDEAGWLRGPDGMRSKDGKPLQITFGTAAGVIDRAQTQVLLQSSWKEIGVDTIARVYPPATFFAPQQAGGIVYGGKEDVSLFAFFLLSLDPSQIDFLAADRVPPAGINAAFWRNAQVTALETAGATTFDPAARRKAYDTIQRLVARDVPYITLRWWTAIEMRKTTLRGVEPPLVGSVFWNVSTWEH